jgi:hypothetical protein
MGKFTRTNIKSAELEKRATELRLAGYTYRKIAEIIGNVTHVSVYKAVLRSLKRNQEETLENAEMLRAIEQERLERLIAAADVKAQAGDIAAIEVVRKLSESLRKLNGIDAPAKQDVTSNGQTITWREFISTDTDDNA